MNSYNSIRAKYGRPLRRWTGSLAFIASSWGELGCVKQCTVVPCDEVRRSDQFPAPVLQEAVEKLDSAFQAAQIGPRFRWTRQVQVDESKGRKKGDIPVIAVEPRIAQAYGFNGQCLADSERIAIYCDALIEENAHSLIWDAMSRPHRSDVGDVLRLADTPAKREFLNTQLTHGYLYLVLLHEFSHLAYNDPTFNANLRPSLHQDQVSQFCGGHVDKIVHRESQADAGAVIWLRILKKSEKVDRTIPALAEFVVSLFLSALTAQLTTHADAYSCSFYAALCVNSEVHPPMALRFSLLSLYFNPQRERARVLGRILGAIKQKFDAGKCTAP